jgi:hypothetical protein
VDDDESEYVPTKPMSGANETLAVTFTRSPETQSEALLPSMATHAKVGVFNPGTSACCLSTVAAVRELVPTEQGLESHA